MNKSVTRSPRERYPGSQSKSPRRNLFSPTKAPRNISSPTRGKVEEGVEVARSPTKGARPTQPPALPPHEPLTPSKKADPQHIPYYVTNFEYILSCVLDCTDDRWKRII